MTRMESVEPWVSMKAVRSAVFSLFASSRPTTVGWLVIAVVIEAIKGMKRAWAAPHVGDEIDVSRPAFTASNAASTVSFVGFTSWVVAPLAHTAPDSPFWSFVRFSVNAVTRDIQFSTKTSARTGMTVAQASACDEKLFSAITFDPPFHMSMCVGENGQSFKTLTRDIDEFGHCLLLSRAVVSSGDRALEAFGRRAILAGYSNG